MKSSLLGLMLMMLLGITPASPVKNMEDMKGIYIPKRLMDEDKVRLILERDGVLKVDGIPYSGYLVSYHSNGTLASRKGFYQGRLEGAWFTYFPDGVVESNRMYHLGQKHGIHEGYYENGKEKFSYLFENGLSEGTHRSWYRDGQLSKEQNYTAGHEMGTQRVWRRDGKMKSNYVVRENGRRYGMIGVKRCAKIDTESGDIDPYKGTLK